MAANFIQTGEVLTVTAPGAVSSGDPVIISGSSAIIGVATHDAASGADVEIKTRGVFQLPLTAAGTPDPGDLIYWDATPGECTETATGNTLIGICHTADTTADTVNVIINATTLS